MGRSRQDQRPRRGRFVVLVGPDGVGKTSVARCLIARYPGETAYIHFRPPVWQSPPATPPGERGAVPPKNTGSGLRPLGWLRLARSWAWFWTGYLVRVRPALRRGALAVADRWAYGYLAQPRSVKFHGPARLAALAVRVFPQPDLVANLAAPPEVIHNRKRELSVDEIREELTLWPTVPAPRLRTFDAGRPPAAVAADIEGELA